MGIYSNSYVGQPSDYGYDETLDSIMLDESVRPCESDDLVEAGLDYIQTMQENYNSIFMRIGQAELQALEESGQQMVYTEGVLSSIWNVIKNFLKKIWEKIKSLFKRFMMIIDSYTKTDKEFLNKYRNQILSPKNMSDFTFKGYKWHIEENEVSALISKCDTKAKRVLDGIDLEHVETSQTLGLDKEIDKAIEDYDEFCEELRGEILQSKISSAPKTATEKEFREELRKYFKGNEEEKQDLDNKDINIHNIVGELSTSADVKKKVNKVFNENKKSIQDTEKTLDKIQKEQIKNTPYKGSDKDDKVYDISTGIELVDFQKMDYKLFGRWLQANPATRQGETETDDNGQVVQGSVPGAKGFKLKNYTNKDGGHFLYLFNDNDSEEKKQRDFETNLEVLKHNKAAFDEFKAKIKPVFDMKPQYIAKDKITKKQQFDNKTKRVGLLLKFVQTTKTCVIVIDSEFLNALKERSRQNKAICIKIVSYNPKKENMYLESYNENFSNDVSYINRNFISDIRLK